jgi:DNA modification methylase
MVNEIKLGNAYEIIKEIPDKSVDLIYTDIPYLHQSGGSGTSKISKNILSKTKEIAFVSNGIDFKIFDDFVRVMKKINIFIWCSRLQIVDILNYFVRGLKCNYEILVWVKSNPIPQTNNIWLPDIEYCLYFREAGVRLNNGYELKSKWYLSPSNTADKGIFAHPTIKPLTLVKRHIAHTTKPGDIVFDPFVGSGTTAVAAFETNRQYIGIEIDPKWHGVAVDRLNHIDTHGQVSFLAR